MKWFDFFRSRYVCSLEQQLAELKAEKAELKADNARLHRLLVPGLRVVQREEQPQPNITPQRKPAVDDNGKVERMPPVRGWQQARQAAEAASDLNGERFEAEREAR